VLPHLAYAARRGMAVSSNQYDQAGVAFAPGPPRSRRRHDRVRPNVPNESRPVRTRERVSGAGSVQWLAWVSSLAPSFEARYNRNDHYFCTLTPVHDASLAPHTLEFLDL